MHDLRHRFAHDGIELWGLKPNILTTVGRWANIGVVFIRCYGRSKDLLETVFEKTSKS